MAVSLEAIPVGYFEGILEGNILSYGSLTNA
jgi:hypothetical protein